ncbi:MAG: hypothetical protein CO189_10110 [candidate division Zixibacteria bacterium CG_4_9_14_3_um_filter_46_8]|nr:MAG: hypothetical protein CO189_10110 [candidate division Zixibacteria bacterium CG_4_9_14_3_um_filter_46_8]
MKILGCQIIRAFSPNTNQVALTFDDGPHPKMTPKILEILDYTKSRATFFVTGENLIANRELAKLIHSRGHLLGNHTFSHPNALLAGRGKLQDEIYRSKSLIEDITGKTNRIFRPPYGIITPTLLSICRNLELSIILWNSNSKDYRMEKPEVIVKRIEGKIRAGSIVLFHECHFKKISIDYNGTLSALKSVVEILIMKKLQPVILDMKPDGSFR